MRYQKIEGNGTMTLIALTTRKPKLPAEKKPVGGASLNNRSGVQ